MTKILLKDIPGLMIARCIETGSFNQRQSGWEEGYNYAIDQIGEKAITINREKLAKQLSKSCIKGQIPHPKEYWLLKAKAIISNLDKIIEVDKEDK